MFVTLYSFKFIRKIKWFILISDLMLPGIVLQGDVTPSTFRHIQKGDICAVNILGNV